MRADVNQYVNLIHTLPEYILVCENHALTDASQAHLARKLAQFGSVAVEIGSGSGEHLVAQAQSNPATLWIGFELRFKRVYRTAEKALEAGLENLLVIHLDARRVGAVFGPSSLDYLYILFPDPWEKRRWRKNRIVAPTTLPLFHQLLKPGGQFIFKSDHQQYFQETLSNVARAPGFTPLESTPDLYASPYTESNVPSEFERLFRYQGLPIGYVRYAITK